MSDNKADIVLITADTQLRELIESLKPDGAVVCALKQKPAKKQRLPKARHYWYDLDAVSDPEQGPEHDAKLVYFYSTLPSNSETLPCGLFMRKPCGKAVISVLWAGVMSEKTDPTGTKPAKSGRTGALLPNWILDLHQLDLREFCQRCVDELPRRLGYVECALYLHDTQQKLLTLAESNSRRYVDLAVPLGRDNDHLLSVVARSRKPLITEDLATFCQRRDMRCPEEFQHQPNHSAVVAPLVVGQKLEGLLELNSRHVTAASKIDLSLDDLFEFLGRCLQHARQYQRARIEARVDRLTGLYNYRWIMETLNKEIRRSARYRSALSLILIDLDELKTVNDRFGHLAGDSLLRHAAGKISAALRQIDSAARIGGDEFIVLLPATGIAGARQVAQRILAAIHTDAPVIKARILPVAASLGVAQWEKGWDEKQLIAAADQAMYAAKREGHNRLVCHVGSRPEEPAAALSTPEMK